MIDDFDEELAVHRIPRRFSRRVWEWQVWRTVDRENTWGDIKTRRAVVASGRCRTREQAESDGRDALIEKVNLTDERLDS